MIFVGYRGIGVYIYITDCTYMGTYIVLCDNDGLRAQNKSAESIASSTLCPVKCAPSKACSREQKAILHYITYYKIICDAPIRCACTCTHTHKKIYTGYINMYILCMY